MLLCFLIILDALQIHKLLITINTYLNVIFNAIRLHILQLFALFAVPTTAEREPFLNQPQIKWFEFLSLTEKFLFNTFDSLDFPLKFKKHRLIVVFGCFLASSIFANAQRPCYAAPADLTTTHTHIMIPSGVCGFSFIRASRSYVSIKSLASSLKRFTSSWLLFS